MVKFADVVRCAQRLRIDGLGRVAISQILQLVSLNNRHSKNLIVETMIMNDGNFNNNQILGYPWGLGGSRLGMH